MITFCPLASGSKGNAVIVSTDVGTLLFDAGISAKMLNERLASIQMSIDDIDAIVISHEHRDHIAGVKTLALRHQIPVIANYATAEVIVEAIGDCPSFHIFTTGEPFDFLEYHITPFSVQHDGIDPVAFTIETNNKKLAICTDIGAITPTVRHMMLHADLIYIEANHQPSMVHSSSRPDVYKQRVLSRTGHLSNETCAQLLVDIVDTNTQQIYLAHLSSECNSPEVAQTTVQNMLARHGINLPIVIAQQHAVSDVTTIL